MFSGKVCDDLIAAGTEAFAGDEEEEGAELGVRWLAPGVPAPIRPPDQDCTLLLTLSEETLPARITVLGTREATVRRALLLLSPGPIDMIGLS